MVYFIGFVLINASFYLLKIKNSANWIFFCWSNIVNFSISFNTSVYGFFVGWYRCSSIFWYRLQVFMSSNLKPFSNGLRAFCNYIFPSVSFYLLVSLYVNKGCNSFQKTFLSVIYLNYLTLQYFFWSVL